MVRWGLPEIRVDLLLKMGLLPQMSSLNLLSATSCSESSVVFRIGAGEE